MKKLFVRNIPFTLDDEGLEEIFKPIGSVTSATVVKDRYTGKSRGFGFVEMSSSEEAARALKEINGTMVDGREIVVDNAKDNRDRS